MYLSKKNLLSLASSEKAMKELNELHELVKSPDVEERKSEVDILAYTLRHTLQDLEV